MCYECVLQINSFFPSFVWESGFCDSLLVRTGKIHIKSPHHLHFPSFVCQDYFEDQLGDNQIYTFLISLKEKWNKYVTNKYLKHVSGQESCMVSVV